jgi:hypothetical protein
VSALRSLWHDLTWSPGWRERAAYALLRLRCWLDV